MKSIWKKLHELYKEDNDDTDGFYIIPCDECKHFGKCKYEKQCEQDVRMGRGLEHFKEIN